ncbi:MAG: hypothetical protein M3444_09140 [Acidobacteriota bacterium]|nr:hypothetical protein [Acidobacteriota bacterium]MDQ5836663.1 hypothetical protein [Acidobacteriota bacterium]
MEETKETNESSAPGEGGGTPQRDAEATSGETLSDIEESEKVSTGGGAGSESSPLETSTPSPDAGGSGRADGSETGGPM